MPRTKVFFDCEFTGLHKNTTLISIGLISECGKTFYAELTDYDRLQINDWVRNNVISKLNYPKIESNAKMASLSDDTRSDMVIYGTQDDVKFHLIHWLKQFKEIEMWGDVLAYNWVLFCQIFGGGRNIPCKYIGDDSPIEGEIVWHPSYIPFDIATLFYVKGIDPDINREEYVGVNDSSDKHNALHDARIIRKCFNKLHLVESEKLQTIN
jgi:hypothetical protein